MDRSYNLDKRSKKLNMIDNIQKNTLVEPIQEKNLMLCKFDEDFEKSKRELIDRFLNDQRQLNYKFDEFDLSTHDELNDNQDKNINHNSDPNYNSDIEEDFDQLSNGSLMHLSSVGSPSDLDEDIKNIESHFDQSLYKRNKTILQTKPIGEIVLPNKSKRKKTLKKKLARPKTAFGHQKDLDIFDVNQMRNENTNILNDNIQRPCQRMLKSDNFTYCPLELSMEKSSLRSTSSHSLPLDMKSPALRINRKKPFFSVYDSLQEVDPFQSNSHLDLNNKEAFTKLKIGSFDECNQGHRSKLNEMTYGSPLLRQSKTNQKYNNTINPTYHGTRHKSLALMKLPPLINKFSGTLPNTSTLLRATPDQRVIATSEAIYT